MICHAEDCDAAITGQIPTITSVSPNTLYAGKTYNILVTGFFPGDSAIPGCQYIEFWFDTSSSFYSHGPGLPGGSLDPYVTVNNYFDTSAYISPTQTMISVTIAPNAPTETDNVMVTCDGCDYQAYAPVQIVGCVTPTITSISPSTWFAGKTYDNVAITGTNFTTKDKATASCPETPVSITAADGSSVPVSNVRVDSKTKITVTIAPAASAPTEQATVTVGVPSAAGSAQTYTAQILGNQIQCDPSMNCTQPVISTTDGSAPPVQSVVIGQPIILTTNPNLPATITPYKTTWTVKGTNIGGYTPTPTSYATASVTKTDLKSASLNTYWVYTGTGIPVTYQYCVNIPGVGNQCSGDANAAFNVTGPGDAQMTVDAYGAITISKIVDRQPCLPSDTDFFLQYGIVTGYDDAVCPDLGGEIGNPPGIKFTMPEASSSGNYSFVQLVKQSTTTYSEGKNGTLSCPTKPGLDGARGYPYPLLPGTDYTNDSPDVQLETFYSKVSRTFKATMYLMWTSNISGSIPVPISSQSWQFTQASSRNSGYPTFQSWTQPVWNLIGADGDPVDYVQTAPSQPPYGYPTWTGLATPVAYSVCPTTNSNENEEQQEDEQ